MQKDLMARDSIIREREQELIASGSVVMQYRQQARMLEQELAKKDAERHSMDNLKALEQQLAARLDAKRTK